jgi:hypothetical protein
VTLSRGLTFLAVALGGYLPAAFALSSGVRLLASVLLTSALVLSLGFKRSGRPRRLPSAFELSRRRLAVLLPLVAVFAVAPFAVLHPLLSFSSLERGAFSSNPNPPAQGPYSLARGGHLQISTAMKPGHVPIVVTAAKFLGTGGDVRADRLTLTVDEPPFPFRATGNHPLTLHVDAGQALWVSARLTLIKCVRSAVTVSAVRISYRELGFSLSQDVPLDQAPTVTGCRQ